MLKDSWVHFCVYNPVVACFSRPVLLGKILLEGDSGQREAGQAWEERGKRDYMGPGYMI